MRVACGRDLEQELLHLRLHFSRRPAHQLRRRKEHYVHSATRESSLVAPVRLADSSLQKIPRHGVAEASARSDSDAVRFAGIVAHTPTGVQEFPARALSLADDSSEVVALADPLIARKPLGSHVGASSSSLRGNSSRRQGTMRLRPCLRRAFNTLRPAFVDIRLRKPCVRRRRIRLGLNVALTRRSSCHLRGMAAFPARYPSAWTKSAGQCPRRVRCCQARVPRRSARPLPAGSARSIAFGRGHPAPLQHQALVYPGVLGHPPSGSRFAMRRPATASGALFFFARTRKSAVDTALRRAS